MSPRPKLKPLALDLVNRFNFLYKISLRDIGMGHTNVFGVGYAKLSLAKGVCASGGCVLAEPNELNFPRVLFKISASEWIAGAMLLFSGLRSQINDANTQPHTGRQLTCERYDWYGEIV